MMKAKRTDFLNSLPELRHKASHKFQQYDREKSTSPIWSREYRNISHRPVEMKLDARFKQLLKDK